MTTQPMSRYLQYLPAIFQQPRQDDGDGTVWINQFLLAFEQEFTRIDDLLAELDQYFSPVLLNTEQNAEFLPWLATWVALTLDEDWDEDQRRRLIGEAVKLYRWRGTEWGLKRYLQLYTGLAEDAIEIQEAQWPGGMQIGVASRIGLSPPPAVEGDSEGTDGSDGEEDISLGDVMVDRQNYYVIDTLAPPSLPATKKERGHKLPPDGTPLRLYCRTDRVEQVAVEPGGVRLHYRTDAGDTEEHYYPKTSDAIAADPSPPNIQRRSKLIEYQYCFSARDAQGTRHAYQGGTFLLDDIPMPYRFIVKIRIPEAELPQYIDIPACTQKCAAGDTPCADGQTVGEADATNRDQDETGQSGKLAKIRTILDLEKPAHTEYYLQLVPEKRQAAIAWMQIEVHSTIGLDTTTG